MKTIRADLTPAEKAAHHARRKELHERKHPETVSVTKRGGPGRGKRNGRQNGEGLADRYTKDAAEKTGDSERTVQRHVERGKGIPNVAELAGTSLDQGAELDALAKLKDMAPDRQAELIEKGKAGEKVSARAEIKKAQQERREAELNDVAEPELPLQPAPEPTESMVHPVIQESASSDHDATAAQDLAPVPRRDNAPPTAPDQPAPTPDPHPLDVVQQDEEADLPTYFGASRRRLTLDERLGNLLFLTEGGIGGFVEEMRAAGRLPELFRRFRKLIDKLEAEAAADGDQTEDCAESAAIERATLTREEMPPSPAA